MSLSDGDTLSVLRDNPPKGGPKVFSVRLAGIDTPEKAQPFGGRAKKFTAAFAGGKRARVVQKSTDRYGRAVARVYVGKKDLNAALVQAGLAWHYKRYSKDKKLAQLEAEARAKKRGLWADKAPTPPWQWRAARRAEAQATRASPTPPPKGPLRGNTRSKKVHRPGCPGYKCKNCKATFNTANEARAAGYRPCGSCKPWTE